MTAIVGLVHNGEVWLAGDRCVATGTSVVPSATPKVWRSGEMVVGCAGEQSWMMACRAVMPPGGDNWAPDSPLAWLTNEGLGAVRRRLADWGQVGKANNGAEVCEGSALIGHRGRLYEVNGAGMTVIECAQEVAGVGCGADLAIGTVLGQWASGDRSTVAPERILRCALTIAATFSAYVRAPFDVVTTGAQP